MGGLKRVVTRDSCLSLVGLTLAVVLPVALLVVAVAFVATAWCVTPTGEVTGTLELPGWAMVDATVDEPSEVLIQPWAVVTVTALNDPAGEIELPLFADASVLALPWAEWVQMAREWKFSALDGGRAHEMRIYADGGFDLTLQPHAGDRLQFFLYAGDVRTVRWFPAKQGWRMAATADGAPAEVTLKTFQAGGAAEYDQSQFSGRLMGGRSTFGGPYVHLSGVHVSQLREEGLCSTVLLYPFPDHRQAGNPAAELFFSFDLSAPGSNSQAHGGLAVRKLTAGGAAGILRVGGSGSHDQTREDVLDMELRSGTLLLGGPSVSFKGRAADVSLNGDQLVPSLWGTFPEPARALIWIVIGALLAPTAASLLRAWRWARGNHSAGSSGAPPDPSGAQA
jgi:hypothetical protein